MKKEIKALFLIAIVWISSVSVGLSQNQADDSWTQFRGPKRNGSSYEKVNGSEVSMDLIWKKEIGSAFSELLVEDDIIYTMDSQKIDSTLGFEYVVSFDAKTGNEIWRTQTDSIFIDVDGWGDGPRSTPAVGKNYLFSLSGKGKLSAYDKKVGKLIWTVDLVKEYGSTAPRWGFSTSPLLLDEAVIVEAGGLESKLFMAFNQETGAVIWTKNDGATSYNSPLLTSIDGQQQIIFANGRTLFSFDSKGDTLWSYLMPFAGITSMPLLIDDNKIFLSGIRSVGFIIVQIENNKASLFIQGNEMKNDFSSCVYHNGFIYGFHVAAVRCISAETGEVKWTKRGFGKGALAMVDDKLLILSDQGRLAIAQAIPDAYTELASVKALEGKCWTAPSFANHKVYVRNLTEMACYQVK